MFYYFGYGSNLSVVSLRAKGVDPLTSEPAVLQGWRLVFDIPDFFTIEGGTGNIQPYDAESVHGVLHGCRSRDLAALDQLEALGTRYSRVETTVTTYSGRKAAAYVYLGLESVLDASCLPSERYRNILVRGANDMNLDVRYIAGLQAIRTHPRLEHPSFHPPPDANEAFGVDRLRESPTCTALAGRVFDMSGARAAHAYMQKLLGGKDATLLFLKRMDTSTGTETADDVMLGRLAPAQKDYINAYLHEFAREYRCVGQLSYDKDDDGSAVILGSDTQKPARATKLSRESWAPPHFPSQSVGSLGLSARSVLDKAEAARAELGHENLGFLSSLYGFMPATLPQQSLPREYAAWDQVANDLPELYRSLRLRRVCDALPVLSAAPEDLPDTALLRAAIVLGMLSHAYGYVETSPPIRQPDALARPWAEVRKRLGRGPGVLTYQDLIVYNWRLLDPRRTDPMSLDNMRLLVPTVDNQEERTFYLTQTQILAHASPVVSAVVRAQEAVVTDDGEALESSLMTIIACLQRVVRESLLNINPSPDSATYVDPVVWAKTVAPFAVPMLEGVQGPSGTSSPIFNTLDVFFGRKRYETFLGREIHQLRDTYPPLWREFLAALQDVSIPNYVANRGNAHLEGLLHEARTVYAGPNGFLGRHRMKVYGYLELAFKVGRSVTIGGFKGVFKDRTWDQVDAELEKSRVERVQSFPQSCYYVKVKAMPPDRAVSGVFDVALDVSGTGLRYEAGDRCGVLPENDEALVARTIAALGATGDETVALGAEWKEAIRLRRGYEGRGEVLLSELLRFGQIRPVYPRAAEALHALTQHDALEKAIREGTTHHWELCDVLEMLRADGFDPQKILSAAFPKPVKNTTGAQRRFVEPVGDPAGPRVDPSFLCEIVPPESFRMYSISSVVTSAETHSATELRLTVAQLTYEGRGGQGLRRGVASSFLAAAAGRPEPVSIIVQHPARFSPPRERKTPLVMIAGGTGVAPFRGFLAERRRQLAPADAWLFLNVRSRSELIYEEELVASARDGALHVQIALSREDVDVRWDDDGQELLFEAGTRKRIGDLLRDEKNARELWDLLRPTAEGGRGANVYVCGRTTFAKSAIDALKDVVMRYAPCAPEARQEYAAQVLRELAAEGRFMQEIFSGEPAPEALPTIDVSEIVRHNEAEHGYWIVIEGRVYDLTEYVRLHPGGMRVLLGYAGTDGTEGYTRAHHGRTEIDATREMYALGVVRALDLRRATVTMQGPSGPQVVSLSGAHRAWVKNLYLVVEMQNALHNDQWLQHAITTRDDPAEPRSPYKIQKAIETHERFINTYIDGLVNESFPRLWALTHGLVLSAEPEDWMSIRLDLARAGVAAKFVDTVAVELHASVQRVVRRGAVADSELARLTRACAILEEEAQRFIADVKTTLRDGVRVFEELEHAVVTKGAERLVAACKRLPEILLRYHAALLLRLGGHEGWKPDLDAAPPASTRESLPTTQRLLVCSRYWLVEEHWRDRVVVMRRTAVSFESLAVLVAENAAVLATIRAEHGNYGLVVDMRHAPARNDPAFEDAMRALRETVTARFRRLAVLLESNAGVLQVNRLGRGGGQDHYATMSEAAAMKFAKGEM